MSKFSVKKAVILSIISMIVILAFYSAGGAVSQINHMGAVQTKLTQGVFVWLSVAAAILSQIITKRKLSGIGFRKVTAESFQAIYYGIPILLILMAGLITGIQPDFKYIGACLFLTIGVGFSEEIYFRGFIFQIWESTNKKNAILVSSILFGVCHSANMLGGANLFATLIQIVFAFVFGIVFALLFAVSKSLWPCIITHFLYDFITYITNEGTPAQYWILSAIQTVLLIVYMILLDGKYRRQQSR